MLRLDHLTRETVLEAAWFHEKKGTKSVKEAIEGLVGIVTKGHAKDPYSVGTIIQNPLATFDAEYIGNYETEYLAEKRLGWKVNIYECPSSPKGIWEFCGSLCDRIQTHIDCPSMGDVRYKMSYHNFKQESFAIIELVELSRAANILSEMARRYYKIIDSIRETTDLSE